jgi:hypothetical protein
MTSKSIGAFLLAMPILPTKFNKDSTPKIFSMLLSGLSMWLMAGGTNMGKTIIHVQPILTLGL